MLYDGKLLDTVTMHCAADDNDYSDNDIICISFTASAFKRQDTIDNISIGGITFESTEAEIKCLVNRQTIMKIQVTLAHIYI